MEQLGRLLVVTGVVLAIVGLVMLFGRRLPLDFYYQRDNFRFYFPLGTSILISVVLTLIFTLVNRR
jgi:cell division protein FtsW (lipid II flippase)